MTFELESLYIIEKLSNKFYFTLQDNYTFAQPGIQMKVNALKELIQRIDGEHVCSFEITTVEIITVSFREVQSFWSCKKSIKNSTVPR